MALESRSASLADFPAFARLFPELGVEEPVPTVERFAAAIAPDALVVSDGEEVVGYAWARPRGDRFHVVHVVADPAHRQRGVGSALMKAIAARARGAGFSRWMLNVKPDNVAARRLYERHGMQVSQESVALRVRWTDVASIVAPPGVTPVRVKPGDDARFEDGLELGSGVIESMRALPGRVMIGAVEGADPVGFMAFDPAYPGATALRVRAPKHVRVLLDGARPLALPEHDDLQLFVEGDAKLDRLLTGVGAKVVMRVLQMDGVL